MSLVERLESELPALPYAEDPAERERGKVERHGARRRGARRRGRRAAIGYALARFGDHGPTTVYVSDLWVDAAARGAGSDASCSAHLHEAAARGMTHVLLDVDSGTSTRSRSTASRLRGGREDPARAARRLLATREGPAKASAPSTCRATTPRRSSASSPSICRASRGASAEVEAGPRGRSSHVEPFDREALRKLGRSCRIDSASTVALALEHGAVVRFVHPRPRPDGRRVPLGARVLRSAAAGRRARALRANPPSSSRLTGADPARVRAIARTRRRPGELPPAGELYEQVAECWG